MADKPRTRWDAISEELTNPRVAPLQELRAYISVDGNVEPVLNFQGQETVFGDPEFIQLYPERAYAQARMTASFTMRREALLKLLKEEFKLTLCILTGDVCSDSQSYLVMIWGASVETKETGDGVLWAAVDVVGRRVS